MSDVPDWLITMMPLLTTLVFVTAVGACIRSLVNVLVYRLPRGEGVVIAREPLKRKPKPSAKEVEWALGRAMSWAESIRFRAMRSVMRWLRKEWWRRP